MRATPARKTARLAGGVAAPDDHHLGPATEWRLGAGGGIVDAATLELLTTLGGQPAVVGPRRDQQTLGRDRLAAVKVEHRVGVLECQASDRCGDWQARPELAGLHNGAFR